MAKLLWPSMASGTSAGKHLKLVGLVNPSNYCFANVCLQVCFHMFEFRKYFLENLFKHHISPKRESKLLKLLTDIMGKLSDPRNDVVNLQKMLKVMDYFTIGYIHHDSFEFLLSMLDTIDEELNGMPSHALMLQFSKESANPLRATIQKSWKHFCENRGSIVKQLFYGTECSIFSCSNCNSVSYAAEPSIMFSVALPQKVVQVFLVRESISPGIESVEIAAKTDDGHITAETVAYQLAFMYKLEISNIVLYHLSKDGTILHELEYTARVRSHLRIIAFEMSRDVDRCVLDIEVESALLSPVLTVCSSCLKSSDSLKKCSSCWKAAYCDRLCQTSHWGSGHKFECNKTDEISITKVGFPLLVPFPPENFDNLSLELFEQVCLASVKKFIDFESFSEAHLVNGHSRDADFFQDVQCETEHKKGTTKFETFDHLIFEIVDFNECGFLVDSEDNKKTECSVHSPRSIIKSWFKSSGIQMTITAKFHSSDVDENDNSENGHTMNESAMLEFCLHDLTVEGWKRFLELMETSEQLPQLSIRLFKQNGFECNGALQLIGKSWAIWKSLERSVNSVSVSDCKKATLSQCLLSHFAPIRVSDRSCDSCKQKCDSIKYSYPWTIPNYLLVHFKRAAEFQNISKLSTAVEFPLDNLDLSSFIAIGQPDIQSYSTNYNYRLHSLVQHHGRLQVKGHYTCYIRLPGEDSGQDECWYHFDDENISRVSGSAVARAEPYFLLYENTAHKVKADVNRLLSSFANR